MQRFLEAVINCLALWGVMGTWFLQRSRETGGLLLQLKRLIRGEGSSAGMFYRVPTHSGQLFQLMNSHRVMLTSRIVMADGPAIRSRRRFRPPVEGFILSGMHGLFEDGLSFATSFNNGS